MKIKIIQNIKSVILALILVAGVSYVSAASTWSSPTAAAPGNNVDNPLNVGSAGQVKSGGLTLNTGGAATGLIVQNGNVGIGTATPTQKLDVNGVINVRGNNIRMSNSTNNFFGDTVNLAARVSASGNFYVQNTDGTQPRPLVASNIYANQYCDINGANCKTTATMGGGYTGQLWRCSCPSGLMIGTMLNDSNQAGTLCYQGGYSSESSTDPYPNAVNWTCTRIQ